MIPIVDEEDVIIGYRKRRDVKPTDIYRVAALWITNSKNQILLAQRAFTKEYDPGCWGPAVAGTVEQGENYRQNISKEAEEEIGLKGISFEKGPKVRISHVRNHFTQWFTAVVNQEISEFTINPREVASLKWWNKDELLVAIQESPEKFLRRMAYYVELFSR